MWALAYALAMAAAERLSLASALMLMTSERPTAEAETDGAEPSLAATTFRTARLWTAASSAARPWAALPGTSTLAVAR